MLSQIAVLAIISCVIQIVNDACFRNVNGVILDVVVLSIFVTTYVLNEKRYHQLAKSVFVVFGTAIIFVFAAVVPKSAAVYFIFFPIITVTFLIFNNEQAILKYLAIIYIVSLLLILELTNYQTFGEINITDGLSASTSYYVNLFIALFVIIFSVYNMEVISRKIEENRVKTKEELQHKNAELEKANNELDHFVYSASHDLKSPLTSILGLINVAKHDIDDSASLHYFGMIEARVDKLNGFIKDIISISRNTRTEIEHEQVDMEALIDDIIILNQYSDPDQKISFIKEIALDRKILIDKARIEIILNNLISNAIKYQVRENADKWVKIKTKIEDDYLLLEVCDNGEGIASEHLDKIYNMFFRANQHSDGSGLGLYIVKNVVEKLNGQIKIESVEHQGTKVIVSIKVRG